MRALAGLALVACGCAATFSTATIPTPDGVVTVENRRLSFLRQGHAANETTVSESGAVRNVQLVCDQQVSGNATLGAVGLGALAGGAMGGPVGAAAGAAAGAGAAVADAYFGQEVSHEPGPCPAFDPEVVPVVSPAEPAP